VGVRIDKSKLSNQYFVKESNLVTRCIADETIIVPVKGGVGDLDSIYTLNEVATRIWDLIDVGTDLEEIIETITKEYEVSPEQAAGDVAEFITSLEATGLIRQHRSED